VRTFHHAGKIYIVQPKRLRNTLPSHFWWSKAMAAAAMPVLEEG